MAWSYRKRITIAPGVRLNVSKKGVSTTFGMRGASINVGRNGTYLNTGIPGTGIYSRRKIGGGNPNSQNSQLNKSNYNGCGITTLIFLMVGLFLILSQNFKNPVLLFLGCAGAGLIIDIIINLIIDSNKKEKAKKVEQSIESQIETAKNAFNQSSNPIQKEILQNFISCIELSRKADETEAIIEALKQEIEKKKSHKLEEQLEKNEAELLKITAELDEVQLDVDKDLDDVEKQHYSVLCENFEKILSCKKIWLITSSIRNTELKSSAATIVERKEINFDVGVFNYIKSSFDIPMLRDFNGNIYYIYPRYIIKAQSFINFEVFQIKQIDIQYDSTTFIEDLSNEIHIASLLNKPFDIKEHLPKDVEIVEYTYKHTNKNGTPDLRKSFNPQIPIVKYGQIEIKKFGLTYYISNYSVADEFVTTFKKLQNKKIEQIEEFQTIDKYCELTESVENKKDEISQGFFDEISKSANKLLDLYNLLKSNKKFISLTQKFGLFEKDKEQLASDLFMIDIITCYVKFNEKINLDTKSGFGLLFLLVKKNFYIAISQRNQLNNYKSAIEEMVEIYFTKREIYISTFPNVDLFIADLLNDYQEMKSKYLILLYRFFSIVAKADGNITEDEQKWLSKLLNLSENTNEENTKITEPDFQLKTKSTQKPDFKEELNSLIGLASVKTEISTLTNFIKIQQERQSKGLKTSQPSYHCVFTGNPGTGKTNVARIVAEIYKELGILKKGHLVETDRSGLVAEYVGQTAVKTNKIIDTALDGVLFIDEAYSLISESGNDYGKEAIATLLKRMEDNRDRLVVILAGYTAEMQNFIDSNPGLQSRFNRYIEFPDYSAEELYQIFELNLKQFDYTIAENAIIPLQEYLAKTVVGKDKNFGNARFVRNLFEKAIERQANRLSKEVDLTNDKLSEICFVDIPI